MQQLKIAEAANWHEGMSAEIAFRKANKFYNSIKDLPPEQQARIVRQLKQLNNDYWQINSGSRRIMITGGYVKIGDDDLFPLAAELNRSLIGSLRIMSMHTAVITELETLVQETGR